MKNRPFRPGERRMSEPIKLEIFSDYV